jgi:hypothetical protein
VHANLPVSNVPYHWYVAAWSNPPTSRRSSSSEVTQHDSKGQHALNAVFALHAGKEVGYNDVSVVIMSLHAVFASNGLLHGAALFIPWCPQCTPQLYAVSSCAHVTSAGALYALQQQPLPSGAGAEAG